MWRSTRLPGQSRHGGILITTLVFSVVISTILAGLGTLIISYYSRVSTESQYASAINAADAGVNYELRRINESVSTADLAGSTTPPGSAVTIGNATFYVYCTMSDGSTAWDKATTPFCIYSTGVVGTSSRTVKINANSVGSSTFAGLFAIVNGTTTGTPTINGSVATNGTFDFQGTTVSGSIIFDGSSAGFSPAPTGGGPYTTVSNVNAVAWPTTSAVALQQFPDSGATAPGGLSYLSIHNDNATAIPAIIGDSINLSGSSTCTLVGKTGGSNYYLTNLQTSGSSYLVFNNTNGPINIWFGPDGGNGNFTLTGGAAAVPMTTDPTKAVRIYVATTHGVSLTGQSELDAGIYNVTGNNSLVSLTGTAALYNTTVVCDDFKLTGSTSISTPSGYFTPPPSGPYGFANYWVELNGM